MGRQVIQQILSPTNAPYVNGTQAELRFSAAVLKNLYQGLVEKGGLGVNDKFVSAADAEGSAQVFVNKVRPVKMKPRELGANKNGASFSNVGHFVQTDTVGIEILTVLDDPITIPRANQDMINVDLLAEQTEIYSNRLKTILNGATAASKLFKTWDEKAKGHAVNELVISADDVSGGLVLQRFIEGNSLLDEGDASNGVDIFPEDTRIAVFKTSYRAILKAKGILTIGGANAAYDIAKGSGLNGDTARRSEDGFIGYIDEVPVHLLSNESLEHASNFLGFPDNELRDSTFKGYISSSYANARGVSTSKQTKIVDAIAGQGLILQPYTKFGVVSWYAKGNVIVTDAQGYSPFADLKTIFSGVAADITFKLKAAGSRLFPVIAFSAKANAKFTATVNAYDDFDVPTDHVKGLEYVVTTKECKTVCDVITEIKDSDNESGTFTSGVEKTFTSSLTSGKHCYVLAIADDGSCSFAGYDYAA